LGTNTFGDVREPGLDGDDYFLYNLQSCRVHRDQKACLVKMPKVEVTKDLLETKELLVSKVKRVQR